ncbi:FAD-dependent oxidoreductase [Chloroflexota bacterium]
MLIQKADWNLDADVVVIGSGAAGVTAAITAHEAGANVIILEKQEAQTPISNSLLAGGDFLCPSEAKGAEEYLRALCRVDEGLYWTDLDVIHAWATYTVENKKWLENLGGSVQLSRDGGPYDLPGRETVNAYRFRGMGPGLMQFLYDQVNQRHIPLLSGMQATNLLTNTKGEVVGVKALKQPGSEQVNVEARRAVVLATGGFEFDEQAKLQYLKAYPFYFTGALALTGDGIRMALDVGAQLWHMNCCSAGAILRVPVSPQGMRPGFGGPTRKPVPDVGYIITDRSGMRYTDENFESHVFACEMALYESKKHLYPRIPSYWIFDHKRFAAGSLNRRRGPRDQYQDYSWSSDNSEELERGWIKRGDTLKELGLALGMETETLLNTVNNYNLYCKNGLDADFSRKPETLAPLNTPPYYAVELWPGGPNTQGGPRRDSKAQVLRYDGSPIPRLYSAGELGSIYGMLYPGSGGNLAECFAFGRIAGENASHCPPL